MYLIEDIHCLYIQDIQAIKLLDVLEVKCNPN